MRSLGVFRAPYLREIEVRAQDLGRRFGGRVKLVNIVRDRRDSAELVVEEEPTGVYHPGLANELDRVYAGGVADFRPASPRGFYWVSK